MEIKHPYKSKKSVKEIQKFNLISSPTYESYLEKKGRNIFVGWQKRYFIFLEEKLILYTEKKENKKVKGYFSIKLISNIQSSEGNTFSIEYEGRTIMLRAENQEIKNNWIDKIKYAFTLVKKGSLKDNNTSTENKTLFDFIFKTKEKRKLSSISSKMGKIAKKYGYILNQEDNTSKPLLEKFGIDKLINFKDNEIERHVHYGFMFIKQRFNDTFEQRWFFLFSRICLHNDKININNNSFLDEKRQKKWIKFEVLYNFKSIKDKTDTYNDNIIYDEEIKMEECNKIINYEKNDKYYISIDYKDRIYEFYCETKIERDEWFEALINSKRIAKTYKYSITNHPRNIDELYQIFIKNKKSFYKKVEQELISITGNTEELSEFEVFEFTINNLRNFIESNLDGCLCSHPIKIDFLKSYTEYANKKYLIIFKNFWDLNYNKINNENNDQLIKMGLMLLNYYDEVNVFNINDINLLENGKEFVQMYFQKISINMLFSIENAIKFVIQHKGSKNKEGLYYTEGPKFVFDIFWKIFDLVKNMKHKIIFNFLIKILNILIFQYCLGINYVLSNRWIIMEDEFLLAVSNDTLIFNDLINDFIEKFKNLKIYTEEEINEEIQIKKLIGIIDKLNNNAVIHLVYEHKDLLEKEIEKEKYLKIDLINIIKKSAEIYAKYKSMMNNRVVKIFYNEILKITLCYYITKIVLIPNKKKVKKEDIISKIKKDKDTFFNAFSDLIGQNLTNSTLILLDYIINLLEIDKNKITSPILTIRQYIGPAFTYSVAKELIKLRSDLKKEEIINCKTLCEEVLNGYESPKEESSSSYFQMLSSKVKKNEKDKEYEQIRASQLKFGEDLIKDKEKGKNELIFYDNKINEINNNSYNDSDMEDEIRSSIAINMTNERNFIRTSMIDLMKDNDNNNDIDKNIDKIEEEEEEDDEENEINEDIEDEKKPDYEGII